MIPKGEEVKGYEKQTIARKSLAVQISGLLEKYH